MEARLSPPSPLPPGGKRLVLVGNPNVGKSVLFGLLTGRYVTVSNYPGTTVEVTTGTAVALSEPMPVVDTPGTNSLVPQSEDERVTRDILLEPGEATLLQVGDTKNLARVLTLALQVAETGRPMLLCLNMMDEARDRGVEIDRLGLSRLLGVPVVETAAVRRQGFDRLREEIFRAAVSPARVDYGEVLEEAIAEIEPLLPSGGISRRSLAVMVLVGDRSLGDWMCERVGRDLLDRIEEIRRRVAARFPEPVAVVLQRQRRIAAERILAQVFRIPERAPSGLRAKLGTLSMHPVWGVPFLFGVLVVAYWFVGVFGAGFLVDLLENGLFNRLLNPWAIALFDRITPFPHLHALADGGRVGTAYALAAGAKLTALQGVARFLHDFVVGEYGVMTMALTYAIAIVLPVVGTFFLFFGVLEDSGYLPRLTVMVDRLFRVIGLNGKAVLPMVLGLGCDTMATLTTRILETKKERIVVTLLLALSIPCSAQLGVLLGMLAGVSLWGTILWLGVVMGSILVVGFLARMVIPGRASDFLLELPPVRMPKLSNIVIKTLARVEWYLREAVPLFVLGTVILLVMDRTGLLDVAISVSKPVVEGLLGLPAKATQAFLIGFLRRDYGAAGLFAMQKAGELAPAQVVVSLTVITLFVPCVANFFMMWKERGAKAALGMVAFIVPFAVLAGAFLRWFIAVARIPL
jgi:ferrous iron transport protein B